MQNIVEAVTWYVAFLFSVTGCAFSAALAAGLARGQSLPRAAAAAQATVYAAIRRARPAGTHWPLNFI